MAKQDTAEKSDFLQNQERIMALRAQQDRDVAERQKYTLQPAVNEKQPADGGNLIETYNRETSETTFRTVQPLTTLR